MEALAFRLGHLSCSPVCACKSANGTWALPQPPPREEPYGLDLLGISVCKMIHITNTTDRTTVLTYPTDHLCSLSSALTFLSEMGVIGLGLSCLLTVLIVTMTAILY